jgi:hypothetical protein
MGESQLNSVIEIFLTETQRGILGGAKVDMQINSLDMLEKDILLHRTKLTQRDVCCLLAGDGKRRGLIYMCGQTSRKTKKMASRADKHLTKTANRALRLLCKLAFFRAAHLRIGRSGERPGVSRAPVAAAQGAGEDDDDEESGEDAGAFAGGGAGEADDDDDDDIDDDEEDEEGNEAYYAALTSEARNVFLVELLSLKLRLLRKAKLDLHVINNADAARAILTHREMGGGAAAEAEERPAENAVAGARASPSPTRESPAQGASEAVGVAVAATAAAELQHGSGNDAEEESALGTYTAAMRIAHVMITHSGGARFDPKLILSCDKDDVRAVEEYKWWKTREEEERLQRAEEREAMRREEQVRSGMCRRRRRHSSLFPVRARPQTRSSPHARTTTSVHRAHPPPPSPLRSSPSTSRPRCGLPRCSSIPSAPGETTTKTSGRALLR